MTDEVAQEITETPEILDQPESNEIPSSEEGADKQEAETAKETTKEPATEDLPLPDEDEALSDKDKNKDFIIKRKEKQLARKAQEAAELRAQLEQVSQQRQAVSVHDGQKNAPKREDFDSEDDWLDARLSHREYSRDQEIKAARYQQFVHDQQKKDKDAYDKMQENGATKYADFEDVISPIMDNNGDFPTNEALAKAIFHSDYGDDILYFFGKNYDHAKKIAQMNPIDSIKEVARLEARFKEKRSAKKITKNDHQPMQNIKGGGTTPVVTTGKMEGMSQKDFEAFYEKNFKKKRF